MKCPKCGGKMKCRETRHGKEETYRQYKCIDCLEYSFTVEFTVEENTDFFKRWKKATR